MRTTAEAPKGEALGETVFTTTDGLAIAAMPVKSDGNLWVRFAVTAADPKAAADAEKLNSGLAAWTYKLGSWKQQALAPTLDTLKAPPPPAPAEPAPAPAPAAKP